MNEYQIQAWKGDKQVDNPYYCFNRNEAIKEAKEWLKTKDIDQVDLQVIYNYQDHDSELADVWWVITETGIVKH